MWPTRAQSVMGNGTCCIKLFPRLSLVFLFVGGVDHEHCRPGDDHTAADTGDNPTLQEGEAWGVSNDKLPWKYGGQGLVVFRSAEDAVFLGIRQLRSAFELRHDHRVRHRVLRVQVGEHARSWSRGSVPRMAQSHPVSQKVRSYFWHSPFKPVLVENPGWVFRFFLIRSVCPAHIFLLPLRMASYGVYVIMLVTMFVTLIKVYDSSFPWEFWYLSEKPAKYR